jgi:hypothetical protein
MITLRVENIVRDYESWKEVFDKFDRFRADGGVRAYRVARSEEEAGKVTVDLDFDNADEATAFRARLEQILQTPQSKEQLISHQRPHLYHLTAQTVLTA